MERRTRIGDGEVDLIIGKGRSGVPVLLTGRKSRLTLLAKVANKTVGAVRQAIPALLEPPRDRTHTLTADNGKAFARHEVLADALAARSYCAHPHAA